jgi:AcrR family transcriptional regulator
VTSDRIVNEALLVADELGWNELTLASLANRLGVKLPSLYKHVDGLESVRQQAAVRAKSELLDELTRSVAARGGPDAVRAVAIAYRNWACAHPGRYSATLRAPTSVDDTAVSDALVDLVFRILASVGVHDADLVHCARTMRAALHGFVSLEAAGGFGLPDDVAVSFERLVETLVSAVAAPNAVG